LKELKKLISKDGSVKFLFGLHDNNAIEALYMHDKSNTLTYNSTVCVSSQVGCKVGCAFCATTQQGFVRNLSSFEIVNQVDKCNSYCTQAGADAIKAVVFAGMGEPLLNYENVKAAIHRLASGYGINSFELATVGIVPAIDKMIEDFKNESMVIRLNLSLHASTDEIRDSLIPFNTFFNISDILDAACRYAEAFNRRVRIRYMLIKGLNDTQADMDRLCSLLENKPVKLVISSYNDNQVKGLIPPDREDVEKFYRFIRDKIDSDIFYNFGSDIAGGCGQLRQTQIAG